SFILGNFTKITVCVITCCGAKNNERSLPFIHLFPNRKIKSCPVPVGLERIVNFPSVRVRLSAHHFCNDRAHNSCNRSSGNYDIASKCNFPFVLELVFLVPFGHPSSSSSSSSVVRNTSSPTTSGLWFTLTPAKGTSPLS